MHNACHFLLQSTTNPWTTAAKRKTRARESTFCNSPPVGKGDHTNTWIHAKQYDVNAFFYITILKPSLQHSWFIEFESWFTCAHRYYQFHCILKTKHCLAFRLLDLYSKMIKYLHNINCLKHQSRPKHTIKTGSSKSIIVALCTLY